MHQVPISVLVVLGFLAGLVLAFWVGGIFGVAAPFLWASLVIGFLVGVLFLQKPKLFLAVAFLYYSMFLNGVLFGVYPLPLPLARFYDELVLAVPLAYIVMRSINRTLPKGGGVFALAYLGLAYLSYKLNGVPRIAWLRAILMYWKFYIYWYFCRTAGPWSQTEKIRWFWAVIGFAFVQFIANVFWQGNIVLTKHPDYSIGTVAGAHTVGYISSCALFLLMAWFVSEARRASRFVKVSVAVVGVLIAYDLIFLTDTKHALPLWPLASVPLIFHRSIPARYRIGFLVGIFLFGVFSWAYLHFSPYSMSVPMRFYFRLIVESGKGFLYRTILFQLPKENPVFLLFGAGPGNFCSVAAIHAWRPLAVKYVIPYLIQGIRSGGGAAEASVLGSPSSTVLVLLGEFGWLGALNYLGFWLWVIVRLWREARRSPVLDWDTAQRLALASCLIFLFIIAFLSDIMPFAQIFMPVWLLVALHWDRPRPAPESGNPQAVKLAAASRAVQASRIVSR